MIDPNFQQFASLLALGGTIAVCWSRLRALLDALFSLVVGRAAVSNSVTDAVVAAAWRSSSRLPLGRRLFTGMDHYVHPPRRTLVVAGEDITVDYVLIWHRKWPLLLRRQATATSNKPDSITQYAEVLDLWWLRGTMSVDGFLSACVADFNRLRQEQTYQKRFRVEVHFGMEQKVLNIFNRGSGKESDAPKSPSEHLLTNGRLRLLDWQISDLQPSMPDAFSHFVYPPEIMERVAVIGTWLAERAWYEERCLPWRMGLLLDGPPGTGKSSFVRALGCRFDLPVHVFDLSTFANEDFRSAWRKMCATAPCVALMEDFDSVFRGRENVAAKVRDSASLTFDCLLNCISGVESSDGVLLILTTNNPETLDAALYDQKADRPSRPGRIDARLYFGISTPEQRRLLAERICKGLAVDLAALCQMGASMTMAQFNELCVREALKARAEQKEQPLTGPELWAETERMIRERPKRQDLPEEGLVVECNP